MKQPCHHHPSQPAFWKCPECDRYFCMQCISERSFGAYAKAPKLYYCPKCHVEAVFTGVDNIIEPFWHHLPKFFTYPFSLWPLVVMLSLALAKMVVSVIPFIGGILAILIWGALIKYSYECLKATARGRLAPPELTSEVISEDFHVVFKQFLIFIIIGLLFWFLSAKISILLGLLFLIFIFFFLPAIIILFVSTSSVIHALNPMLFTRLAFRIGWGYVLMYFFLILLYIAPGTLGYLLARLFPGALSVLLFDIANSYYTIIFYHLMGYVLLQYHEEIGYPVEFEDFKQSIPQPPTAADRDSATLEQVAPLIQDGKLDEAIDVIEGAAAAAGGITGLALSERYFNLLKIKKRTPQLLEHGRTHVDLLVQENNKNKACKIFSECLAQDKNFTPSSESLFKLAGWLNELGKAKEAISAFNRFAKTYPRDPLVPKAYFRAAQIFNDRLLQTEKAKKILNGLLKKYPEHEITPQVQNYLSHISP